MSLFLGLLVLNIHNKLVMTLANQLVFGKSANLPSNLVNLPPAMEDVSHADILVKHPNALHVTRKAFIVAASNDKLRRKLKAKNRETAGIKCEIGDMV